MVAEREAEIRWLLPAVGYPSARPRYGLSSCKLIRHCLLDEPLDPTWERPWDHWDLIGVTGTAEAAPAHHREKAMAALSQFRVWLGAEEGGRYVKKADELLAERSAEGASTANKTASHPAAASDGKGAGG